MGHIKKNENTVRKETWSGLYVSRPRATGSIISFFHIFPPLSSRFYVLNEKRERVGRKDCHRRGFDIGASGRPRGGEANHPSPHRQRGGWKLGAFNCTVLHFCIEHFWNLIKSELIRGAKELISLLYLLRCDLKIQIIVKLTSGHIEVATADYSIIFTSPLWKREKELDELFELFE